MKLSSLIKLQDIVKVYRTGETELTALQQVNLSVNMGELVSIVGTSGSGKSTLLNILGLLDRPTSGYYYLNGEEVSTLSDDEQAAVRNKKIGFVFQSFYLLPRLNALENVILPLSYRSIAIAESKIRAMALLKRFHIDYVWDHKPNQLSGGQQQRVAIARALIGEPEVLIADEPTGALDSTTSQEVINLFHTLHQQDNKTIIIVTHDLNVAAQCDRMITIQDGLIVDDKSKVIV